MWLRGTGAEPELTRERRGDSGLAMKPGGSLDLPGSFASRRLAGLAILLLLAIGAVQAIASTLFYEAIDRQTVREDHARRVAELLIVGDRLHRIDPAATGRIMSSGHLEAATAPAPTVETRGAQGELAEIARHIVAWEPALAKRVLMLELVHGSGGRRDLAGSMQLHDGTWLNFRSQDISSSWPIALRATLMTLVIALLCVAAGIYAVRLLTAPLRRLGEAAEAASHGAPIPVRETGPADLRTLARSFNDMQARISGLVSDQARSFEAISHDLRTPLSRLKLASDFVDDSDIAKIVRSSADEMEGLLMSLQAFLRAEQMASEPEPLDLAETLRGLLAEFPERVALVAPPKAVVKTYREPLLTALRPLIDNALQYGQQAVVTVRSAGADWQVTVADNGPGIPAEHFEAILDPFFRLDDARARDTAGFGLGIPTAHRLLRRFGGALAFANAPGGGLVVTVTVPAAGESHVGTRGASTG